MSRNMKIPVVSIDVVIQDSQQNILLGKVSEQWQEGGKYVWGLPGREVIFGEDLKMSAARAIREETGMEMTDGRVACVNSNFGFGNHYIAIGVLATAKGQPSVTRPKDWQEWRWIPFNNCPSTLFPSAERTLQSLQNHSVSIDFDD